MYEPGRCKYIVLTCNLPFKSHTGLLAFPAPVPVPALLLPVTPLDVPPTVLETPDLLVALAAVAGGLVVLLAVMAAFLVAAVEEVLGPRVEDLAAAHLVVVGRAVVDLEEVVADRGLRGFGWVDDWSSLGFLEEGAGSIGPF